jgi:hypothetical protein
VSTDEQPTADEARANALMETSNPIVVEHITGRTVRAFSSSIDTRLGGLAAEPFVFYPEGREGRSRIATG